jgi:hypothetical protein
MAQQRAIEPIKISNNGLKQGQMGESYGTHKRQGKCLYNFGQKI